MTPQAADRESGIVASVFHGYRGADVQESFRPSLSIAVNRQTGARGRQVAERAAEILGLTYYSPETVDLAAHDPNPRSAIDGQAADWIERRTEAMLATGSVGDHPEMRGVVRVLLEIAANGSAVLVGKGATVVLPADSTLRVRIVAPEAMRVAYIAQWERMSQEEARQYVRRREHARAVWLREMFGADQEVAENFDLVLNSEALGVEGCARVLAAAAQAKSPPL